MSEAQNTKVVQDAYEAFLRGDITTLLGSMTDDVQWDPVVGAGSHVPFAGKRAGKSQVGEFFRLVSENVNFEQFEPREYVAQGDKVVALGHYRTVTKATGKSFECDFVMVFTLRDGKVSKFQEFTDSAGINAAFS
jgi:ketosteroid isomerase-like protein